MKKQTLLFLSIITCMLAMAQTTPSFGVRAGLSSYGMRGNAASSLQSLLQFTNGMVATTNRSGYFAGVYATMPLSEKVSLEPALYYSQKGYDLKGSLIMKAASFLGVNAKTRLDLQYIDMPVLVKGNFGGFQLFAGPQVSYLTSADMRTTAGVLGFNLVNNKTDVSNQFSKWDAGITGGVGYQFANGLNITAAYDYGLTKVDANRSTNAYNQGFKVGLGMSF